MAKNKDEGNKRIEAVFSNTGLGNQDPEKITGFLEEYERAMTTADYLRSRKGARFEDVLESTAAEKPSEKNEPEKQPTKKR